MARAAPAMTAAQKSCFFQTLAESANVLKSAKAAGITSVEVYLERKASKTFRDQWTRALIEGYVRLEADMLAEALKPIGNATSEKTIKLMAQKQRDRQFLLNAHSATVRGETRAQAAAPLVTRLPTSQQARADLAARFESMRERISDAGGDDDSLSSAE